jgi:hypothetical protein
MDCFRKELLASAGFSLNQHGGRGGRDSLNLLKYGFKGGAVANDVVELAIPVVLVADPDSPKGPHNISPSKTVLQTQL